MGLWLPMAHLPMSPQPQSSPTPQATVAGTLGKGREVGTAEPGATRLTFKPTVLDGKVNSIMDDSSTTAILSAT